MRTQEKHATRFRSIQTSLLFVIVPAVIISMAVLSLMGYLSSKAIIQTSAGNEMSQCLSVAMGSIEMSLSKTAWLLKLWRAAWRLSKGRL